VIFDVTVEMLGPIVTGVLLVKVVVAAVQPGGEVGATARAISTGIKLRACATMNKEIKVRRNTDPSGERAKR